MRKKRKQFQYHPNQSNPKSPKVKTYDSELVKWPGSLNVLQSLLQATQLSLNLALGLLSGLDSLSLKGVNSLQLTANVVGSRLEALEVVLDLVDDGLVLEDLAVVGEVDCLREFRQNLDLATRIIVTLLEGLQGSRGLAAEAQRGGDLGPVDLESGAALLNGPLADSIPTATEEDSQIKGN